MRNFRKAALAGATAAAVAFGSTAVATAETTAEETTAAEATTTYERATRTVEPTVDGKDGVEPGSSAKIANSERLEFRKGDELQGTDGRALFGDKKNFDAQPLYAKIAYGTSIFTAVSAVIGLVVGPLYNFIVHGDVQF